jgi:hypothetical protein
MLTLSGESFHDGAPTFAVLTCQSGGPLNATFEASGTATGPYPGTFHETGSVVGSPVSPETLTASFTIDSSVGRVTGTDQSAVLGVACALDGTFFSFATESAEESTDEFLASDTYQASIVTASEAFADNGLFRIAFQQGTTSTPGLDQSFRSATVTDDDLALRDIPDNITVNATGPNGAVVNYTPPTATDEGGQTIPVNCDHAPGSTFGVGTTNVTCSASAIDGDDANSPVSASFTVHVKGAGEQVADLQAAVEGVGPGTSLPNKVTAIQSSVASGQTDESCGELTAFVSEVRAQSGKGILATQASNLIAYGQRILAVLGCSK